MLTEFDPTTLGFNFAKDLAVQLITLSTGLLALSATFTKEILKTVSKRKEWLLRVSWIVHVLAILGGVWTLMALTGTLMPNPAKTPGTPYQFGANVRCPAAAQVLLFLVGTILLLIVYGSRGGGASEDEFRVINEAPERLGEALNTLKADRWEVVSMTSQDPARVVALLKRSVQKG